jgi:competence protein ComEC
MKNHWKILLLVLFLSAIAIWLAVFTVEKSKLKVIACDVGQGDGILITLGNTQILTDGGPPNGKLIECLSRYIPFWDRQIEVIINTHPQLDHYGGLIEVVKRYKVKYFLANNLDSGSQEYGVLKNEVEAKGIRVLNPTDDLSIGIGLIYLDILWPTDRFLAENLTVKTTASDTNTGVLGTSATNLDPNEFSIVYGLHYNDFDSLFTGDMSPVVSDKIAQLLATGKKYDWEYIKVPHHGSKNGITEKLLDSLNPMVAVISLGKDNTYGHPHREVINMLNERHIKIFRTDLDGNVVVTTDGTVVNDIR